MEYKFTLNDYRTLAESILMQLTSPDYFSGRIDISTEDNHEIGLTATLVLYRRPPRPLAPDDEERTLTGVGVVWYDVEVTHNGTSIEEDFDMAMLKRFILNA